MEIAVNGAGPQHHSAMPGERAGSTSQGQRSLIGYLVMPRPKDLVKGLLIPVTYFVGVLAAGGVTTESLLRAVLVLAAVELFIYPARYQWNDARGFVADQRHPGKASRGRLPGPVTQARAHVLASCVVAAIRLVAVGVLNLALPELGLGGVLGFATLGVFGIAFAYEWLRSRCTGRTGRVPPPLQAGLVSIWLVVGGGYAVRGMIGLALAVDLSARPALTVSATLTLWAYGVAFVTSRWAIEALAFASIRDGHVVFQTRRGQAREHLLVLVRWLPVQRRSPGLDIERWTPLAERTSLIAPWNVATIAAGSAAAATGRLLCGAASVGQLAAASILGAVLALVTVHSSRARWVIVCAGAGVLYTYLMVSGAPRPLLGVIPWLLLSAARLFFSSRSLYTLGRAGVLTRAVKAGLHAAAKAVLGEPTWAAVRAGDASDPSEDVEPPPPTELVDVARMAATAGAGVAMRWWADHTRLEVKQKRGPRDLVSKADHETEAEIRKVLRQLRPDDSVLGEEGGLIDGTSGIRWIIDPIDGTTSYLYGRPDWAVSVAAVRCSDETIVAGAVVEPVAGWTTCAQRGGGTYLNDRRVRVNDVVSLDHALVEINFGRDDQREVAGEMVHELATRVRDLRRGGSAASALAHVATGRADAVWSPGLQPWDCAAGVLLVEEAGGSVGDLREMAAGLWPNSGDVLAANPALLRALRGILEPIYATRV
jgi:fructose-1,6-bisphosphatase/inositol monophosphatase family enzyme